MKILITHVYSEQNAGDAAILSAMLRQINHTFPHAKITRTSAEKTVANKNQIHSFLYLCLYSNKNNIIRAVKTFYILVISTIWAYTYRYLGVKSYVILPKELKDICRNFAEADLILPVGGGYINGKNSLKSLIVLCIQLHSLVVGKILNKKIVLYSQSIGPFGNKLQMHLASMVLKKMNGIIARENKTVAMLKSLNIDKSKIHKSVDAAFIYNEPLQAPALKFGKNKKIGITVRDWLPEKEQRFFEQEITKFCQFLIEKKHYQVYLIPQVTSPDHNDDDRIPSQRIKINFEKNNNLTVLDTSYTAAELKNIYKNMDYLVGTRMHSVIFALTENVPCIAIEYEYKTKGIMEDLGLDKFTIKIEDVTTAKLIYMFNALEKDRNKYLNILKTSMKNYQEQAYKTGDLIKKIYLKNA